MDGDAGAHEIGSHEKLREPRPPCLHRTDAEHVNLFLEAGVPKENSWRQDDTTNVRNHGKGMMSAKDRRTSRDGSTCRRPTRGGQSNGADERSVARDTAPRALCPLSHRFPQPEYIVDKPRDSADEGEIACLGGEKESGGVGAKLLPLHPDLVGGLLAESHLHPAPPQAHSPDVVHIHRRVREALRRGPRVPALRRLHQPLRRRRHRCGSSTSRTSSSAGRMGEHRHLRHRLGPPTRHVLRSNP
ncbi:hypothetical protein B296_00037777 [Ensete ventricosum]|uniref:Uncharacterized protein n=1 Tax=Ensete ventricosum TaxID=4639 RepID=A0A426Z251_ENSVE|nr:hypothetical protein B296_00037777 [Ensete ventricosum]